MAEKAGYHTNVGYAAGTEGIDFTENQNMSPYPSQQQGQFAPQPMPYTQQPQAGYGAPPQQQYGGQQAYPGQAGPYGPSPPTMIVQQQEQAPPGTESTLTGAYVTSCLTFWCCNVLFGAIGFFIALWASSTMTSRNYDKARRLAYYAIGVSVAGIIVTVILVAVVLGVCLGTTACYRYSYYNDYYYRGYSG